MIFETRPMLFSHVRTFHPRSVGHGCLPDLGQFSFKTVVTLAQNQNELHALLQDYDYFDCAITTVCFDSSTLYMFQFGPKGS